MSDEAGHSIGARIDERLAALFRELCRKELLDERKTEELVSQATSRPAATRPHSGRAPAPALGRTVAQRDIGTPRRHQLGLAGSVSNGRQRPSPPQSPGLAISFGASSGPGGEPPLGEPSRLLRMSWRTL